MFRTESPMTSGLNDFAVSRAWACGSRAKQRSSTRTSWPAWSSAEATHATPLGTTGMGWRSRFALTSSTRGRVLTPLPLLKKPEHTHGDDRPDQCARGIDAVVVQPSQSPRTLGFCAAVVHHALGRAA